MLYDHDLKGVDLPAGSVCLTYDDGPGPQTEALARYLRDEGVVGTFFVVGRVAEGEPGLLRAMRGWGHVLGNHTWSHPGLVTLFREGGDVVEEVARTAGLLRPLADGPVLFRPPYGSWRDKTRPGGPEDAPISDVAGRLRRSGRLDDHVGPVKWDIVAEDWDCWRRGVPVEECARRHVDAVARTGRGILLMHDSSEDEALRPRYRPADLARLLVPALRARGYRFVGPGEAPQVRDALRAARFGTKADYRAPEGA